MPQPTPDPAARGPEPNSRFLSDVVARNVRTWRSLRDLKQADLAARMAGLGHAWTQSIASQVELARRHVTADELLGLALSLEVAPPDLLDLDPLAIGAAGPGGQSLLTGTTAAIEPAEVHQWLRGGLRPRVAVNGEGRMTVTGWQPTAHGGGAGSG